MGGKSKKIYEAASQRVAPFIGIVEKVNAVDQAFPSLLALTRDDSCVSHVNQVESMLESGVRFIQLRSKMLTGSSLLDQARVSADLASQAGAVLIVNDCPEVAARSGACGVHLGMKDGSPGRACEFLGNSAIIGRTVHSLGEAHLIMEEGKCDYVGIGPYRRSQTKGDLDPVLEHSEIMEIQTLLNPLPVYLIGGLGLADFGLIGKLGVTGLAVCSALSRGDQFGSNLKAFVDRAQAFETMEVSS
jgi:thiamine-phosphate pyrophosphorylase